MIVLSLFDGMSCGQIALNRIGIKPTKYYASEIDKHAIKVTQANYSDTIQLGDITQWKTWDIDFRSIDLVLGGSPCQGFSFAGKGLAFDDPRSKLFFVFIDILNHVKSLNPKVKYLLENVRMKYEHELVISRILNINPIIINSALVSAQNRVRLYWTNISTVESGLFGFTEPNIPRPEDKGILLKDILENDVDEKYYIKNVEKLLRLKDNIKSGEGKAACFTAGGHSAGNHSDMDLICVAMRGRNPENPNDRNIGSPTEQRLEPKTDGKTNTLTSVAKDNLVIQLNPSLESGGKQPYQQNRVYDSEGIAPALCEAKSDLLIMQIGNHSTGKISHDEDKHPTLRSEAGSITKGIGYQDTQSRIRRLTPIECERLQTVDDNYTNHVSDSQRYKMLGNGWTVDVICHILKYLI